MGHGDPRRDLRYLRAFVPPRNRWRDRELFQNQAVILSVCGSSRCTSATFLSKNKKVGQVHNALPLGPVLLLQASRIRIRIRSGFVFVFRPTNLHSVESVSLRISKLSERIVLGAEGAHAEGLDAWHRNFRFGPRLRPRAN